MQINTLLKANHIEYLRKQQHALDANIKSAHDISEARWMGELAPNHLLALRVEIAEFINEARDAWKYWKKKPIDRERVIDEAVDNIHFIILHLNKIEPYNAADDKAAVFYADMLAGIDNHPYYANKDLLFILTTLSLDSPSSMDSVGIQDYVIYTLGLILQILDIYEFTTDDIINAYNLKNEENFKRITNNY